MFAIVGHCTKCGCPIYAPSVWNAVSPPPSTYSCVCFSPANNKKSTTVADGRAGSGATSMITPGNNK